ncbi:MAG TPA: hypothetical protein VF173_00340 [Thermoanaerobaculia bacterium]|nr:hypothetical protein [Thermoanaerobaculia bacterium]
MPGVSFQRIISSSELMNNNLKPQLKDFPHLQDESTQLEALIAQAKVLDNEQHTLTGRLREITRLRKEAEQQSQDLRSRVAAQLRGKLGFENETLLGFGIPPRKRSRKKATKPQPTPQTPPPAGEAPQAGGAKPDVKP